MKELISIAGVAAAGLLIIAAAVFAGGDRSLLVPVPEAVTESFMREITTRRFDLAMPYLSEERRRLETPQTLAAHYVPLVRPAGEVNNVSGAPGWMQGDRAAAGATVEGDAGSVSVDFSLVREHGLWKISGVTVGSR